MDNRSNILHAALTLFADRGYDAVGVQEVVEAAGLTKPTLYHYFGSKQGLLEALLERYFAEFNQNLRQIAAYRGDLPLTLERIMAAYFDFATRHPIFYRMVLALWFSPRHSEAHQMVLRWLNEQYLIIEEVFALASRDHGNMKGRQRAYAATFTGIANTYIGLALNESAELTPELVYQAVHQFQHGIYS